jgi:hypothetical protein
VELVGVHVLADTGGPDGTSAAMFSARRAAWVREAAGNEPYLTWTLPLASRPAVQWRDVVILNFKGEYAAVQNLSSTPLSSTASAANNVALRNAMIAQAGAGDLDGDGLPTFWETEFLNTQSLGALADPGKVGRPLLLSYAQGLSPTQQQAGPVLEMTTLGGVRRLEMTYRRLTGLRGYNNGTTTLSALEYLPEIYSSATGMYQSAGWTAVSDTDPYDGTGTRLVRLRSSFPASGAGAPSSQFARLRVRKR